MNLLDLLFHLLNFSAPALVMALAVPLAARWILRLRTPMRWWWQVLLVLAAGLVTLAASLVLLGRDGKMAAYATLVLVTATVQWLMARGWRR